MARWLTNTVQRNRHFHFRRAIPKDIRDRFDLAEITCSLRTADLRLAQLRSRQLYLASEAIFTEARLNPMLTNDQLAAIVQDFYAQVLEQENQMRLQSYPISEESRANRAAWFKQVAERARSDLGSNKLGSAWFVSLSMMRQHGLQGSLDQHEKAQLQQALLRAGIDLAEAMHARYLGDFNFQPKDALLARQVQELFPDQSQAGSASTIESSKASVSDLLASAASGPKFSEIATAFVVKQTKLQRWEAQSAAHNQKAYELFADICGDKPPAAYVRKDAAKFKEAMELLPADYGKAAQFRGKAVERIMKLDTARGGEGKRLSVKTVKRHVSALSVLWDDLIPKDLAKENIFARFKFPKQQRAQDQRPMWTRSELARLFATPIWTGCKSEGRRTIPGSEIIRDEKFWLPLIAVFSGARQEEICQLHLEDIRQEEGVWIFDINMKPPRKLKNTSAARLVPIHKELIRLGLLDYVEACRSAGNARIFPNLQPGGADGRLGHSFTKWFTRYRRDTNVYEPGRDFHSFRHSATTFLHQGDVSDSIIDRLTGHTTPGETARYTKGTNIEQLKRAIDAIDIGCSFDRLYEGAKKRSNPHEISSAT